MEEEAVRWSIKVSKDTDLTLRTFLGAHGMRKGDLSKFIEEAVRRRVLQCTIQDIRASNADADPDEIQRVVDDAVSEVRAERRAKRKAEKSLMRVVLDTNIVVSALIAAGGNPAQIIDAWLDGEFTLLTCAAHIDELRATLEKPRVAELVKPHKAGRLVNQVKKLAEDIHPLPRVKRSADPTDDFLLALSEAGKADYLVTGDKSGLLALGRHKGTQIVSARDFAALFA